MNRFFIYGVREIVKSRTSAPPRRFELRDKASKRVRIGWRVLSNPSFGRANIPKDQHVVGRTVFNLRDRASGINRHPLNGRGSPRIPQFLPKVPG